MMRTRSRRWMVIFLSILFVILSALSAASVVIGNGTFIDNLFQRASIIALFELALIFVCFLLVMFLISYKKMRINGLFFVSAIFLWWHRALIPVLVGGLYIGFLILLGELLLIRFRRGRLEICSSMILHLAHNFLIGSGAFLSFLCVLSLFGIGGMQRILIATVGMAIISVLLYYWLHRAGYTPIHIMQRYPKAEEEEFLARKNWVKISLSYVFTMLLLQAGRINIAIDYDSMRYGLRSLYVLDNGRGIYENLGFVNDVYFYPKGFEILTLPLNLPNSHGFILAFSWLMCIGVLLLVYEIVRKSSHRLMGILAVTITVAIPAVMNMSISAKTDIFTLFFQLLAICDIVKLLSEEGETDATKQIVWAMSSIAFTLVLKPTSVYFSGGLFLAIVGFLLYKKNFRIRYKEISLVILLPTILAVILVTYRTYHLTGFPITSIFTSLLQKIGFHIKYPLAPMNLPSAQGSVEGMSDGMRNLYRIYAILIAPMGMDMVHILIAMPTAIFGVILMVSMFLFFPAFFLKDKVFQFLYVCFLALLIFSTYALLSLYQVDGNYFILLICLSIMVFCIYLKGVLMEEMNLEGLTLGLLPGLLYAVVITMITNWAGAIGFTPLSKENFGYFDHQKEAKERSEKDGYGEIYAYLEHADRTRVVTFAYMPKGLEFRARVESYTDIVGSGGNTYLVKKLDIFKEYLDYADIDYFFTDGQFLHEQDRAREIIRFMLEDKSLEKVVDCGVYALYKYHGGGKP